MANHKSAIKRVRSNGKKRVINRYQHKTARNYIRDFKEIGKKKEALKSFPKLVSLIDKLSKKNIIHSNKAANIKSKLATHLATLK